jgi:hypothetical protein
LIARPIFIFKSGKNGVTKEISAEFISKSIIEMPDRYGIIA